MRETALHPSDQSFSQGQCFNPYYLSSFLNSLFKINITSESCASLSDFYPSSFFHLHLRSLTRGAQDYSQLCLGYWGWKEPSAPWDLGMKQAGAQPFVPSLLSGPGSLHPVEEEVEVQNTELRAELFSSRAGHVSWCNLAISSSKASLDSMSQGCPVGRGGHLDFTLLVFLTGFIVPSLPYARICYL